MNCLKQIERYERVARLKSAVIEQFESKEVVAPMPKEAPVTNFPLITPAQIDGAQINAVNARDLHRFLEVKDGFAHWIIDRIQQYGFVEHRDFEVMGNLPQNPQGGRPSKEYALTLGMAKELSMVERNEKGKLARAYFIDMEKKALAVVAVNPYLTMDRKGLLALALEQEETIQTLECKVKEIPVLEDLIQEAETAVAKLSGAVREQAPKVEFFDDVVATDDLVPIVTFGQMLDRSMGRGNWYRWLREAGYFTRTGYPYRDNRPYQEWVTKGLFVPKVSYKVTPAGNRSITNHWYVTGLGQVVLHEHWAKNLCAAEKALGF